MSFTSTNKVDKHNQINIYTTLVTSVQQYKHRKRIRRGKYDMNIKGKKVGPARGRWQPLWRTNMACRPALIFNNMDVSYGG